jgi:hypothetical protein
LKIYTDDPKVHYITTTISPERTRDEISELLRAYDTYVQKLKNLRRNYYE